jgi:hypothetical protein
MSQENLSTEEGYASDTETTSQLNIVINQYWIENQPKEDKRDTGP